MPNTTPTASKTIVDGKIVDIVKETKTVTVVQSIPNLTDFAYRQGTNLKLLKYFNPWLRGTSLTISAGNSYEIKIPTGDYAKTHGHMHAKE